MGGTRVQRVELERPAPQVIEHAGLDASLWMAGLGIPALCLLGWPWLRSMDRANVDITAVAASCSRAPEEPRQRARPTSALVTLRGQFKSSN